MQGLSGDFLKGFIDSIPLSVITITSQFSISRTYFAPIISRAHVSEANTGDPSLSPNTNGRIPKGSLTPISFLFVKITSEYAPLFDGVYQLAYQLFFSFVIAQLIGG